MEFRTVDSVQRTKTYSHELRRLCGLLDLVASHLKDFAGAMCATSESFACGLRSEEGAAVDALQHLNAANLSNEHIMHFEQFLRQQIYAPLAARADEADTLLAQMSYDGGLSQFILEGDCGKLQQHNEFSVEVATDGLVWRDRLERQIQDLLQTKFELFPLLLGKMSAAQAQLYLDMATILGGVDQQAPALTSTVKNTAGTTLPGSCMQGKGDTRFLKGASESATEGKEFSAEVEELTMQAVDQAMANMHEDCVCVAIAMAYCELQQDDEERGSSIAKLSGSGSNQPGHPTILSSIPIAFMQGANAATGAGDVTPGGAIPETAKSLFSMHGIRKLMSARNVRATDTSEGPASFSSAQQPDPSSPVPSENEGGWLRLEQDFHESLSRAAGNAGKRTPSKTAASAGSFKAFNMPFSLMSKALGLSADQVDEAESPCSNTWSLARDALRYDQAAYAEERQILRAFLPQPDSVEDSSEARTFNEKGSQRALLGSSSRYLDLADLARCCMTCSTWREALIKEEKGRAIWKSVVRRGGCPQVARSRLWRFLMFENVPWLPEQTARRRRPTAPDVRSHRATSGAEFTQSRYLQLVCRAEEQIEHYQKTGRLMAGSASVFGVVSEEEWQEEICNASRSDAEPRQTRAESKDNPQTGHRSNWISEIEVDVQRTYVIDRGYELWNSSLDSHELEESDTSTSESPGSRGQPENLWALLSDPDFPLSAVADCPITPVSMTLEAQSCGKPYMTGASSQPLEDHSSGTNTAQQEQSPCRGDHCDVEATRGARLSGVDGIDSSQECAAQLLQENMTPKERSAREIQRQRLSRVLWAFAVHNPVIRYCQGMNLVAALLLKVTDNDEEAAFALLVGMCDFYGLEDMWKDRMPRLSFSFHVLERLVELRLPSLHKHFLESGIHVAMFSSKWFVTLFANLDTLPMQTVLRIWDDFFIEGWPVIFGVAVSMLEMLEGCLKGLELEDILRVMQDPRRTLRAALQARLSLSETQMVPNVAISSLRDGSERRTGSIPLTPTLASLFSFSSKKGRIDVTSPSGRSPPSSGPRDKMSNVFLRRLTATSMGASVLQDAEVTFGLTK